MIEADISDICHIIHYISRSNEQPNDIFYILLFDKMKNATDVDPTDLILLLESFIANSLHLRYKELLEEIEKRVCYHNLIDNLGDENKRRRKGD